MEWGLLELVLYGQIKVKGEKERNKKGNNPTSIQWGASSAGKNYAKVRQEYSKDTGKQNNFFSFLAVVGHHPSVCQLLMYHELSEINIFFNPAYITVYFAEKHEEHSKSMSGPPVGANCGFRCSNTKSTANPCEAQSAHFPERP